MPLQGWYEDPADPGRRRYWDGEAWTTRTFDPRAFPPPGGEPDPAAPRDDAALAMLIQPRPQRRPEAVRPPDHDPPARTITGPQTRSTLDPPLQEPVRTVTGQQSTSRSTTTVGSVLLVLVPATLVALIPLCVHLISTRMPGRDGPGLGMALAVIMSWVCLAIPTMLLAHVDRTTLARRGYRVRASRTWIAALGGAWTYLLLRRRDLRQKAADTNSAVGRAAAWACLAITIAALAGGIVQAGLTMTWSRAYYEQAVAKAIAAELNTRPPLVQCPGQQAVRIGTTLTCTFIPAEETYSLRVYVTPQAFGSFHYVWSR